MPESTLLRALAIVRIRRARRQRQSRSPGRRLKVGLLLTFSLTSLTLALAAIVAWPAYQYLSDDLPPIARLESLLDTDDGALLHPSTFLAQDGSQLFSLAPAGLEGREFIEVGEAPLLAAAVIASQDVDFYSRPGYQVGEKRKLAEQLVASLLAAEWENNAFNEWRIRLLAAQATKQYGPEQILTWYLNSANFGKLAFGAETAAQLYFGKAAGQLSLAEAAALAATLDAPAINPIDAADLLRQRQQALLLEMLDLGLADQAAVTEALVEEMLVRPDPGRAPSESSAFAAFAIQQAEVLVGRERLQHGGLRIVTTLDTDLQTQLAELAGDTAAGLAVLDPSSGNVLALLGNGYTRQEAPGGVLTPFIYLHAFAKGRAPASLIWDTPGEILPGLAEYSNHDGIFHGPLSLRQALANNYLVPAVSLANEFGAENVLQVAQQAGISGLDVDGGLGALVGSTEITLLQLAHGYSTLANLGQRRGKELNGEIAPSAIVRIDSGEGMVIFESSRNAQQAIISADLAFLINDVLGDSGARGNTEILHGVSAFHIARSSDREWAVGYSPDVVITISGVAASELLPVLFRTATTDGASRTWSAPPGLSSLVVCMPTGLLPDKDCPLTRRDYFLSGFEPTEPDDLFYRATVNRHSGRLATVFTPSEFIVEQLVLNVPAGSRDWALSAGYPLAPEEYDVVLLPSTDSDLSISNPDAFAQVTGVVEIRGTARAEDFEEYRVLVGKGLYPNEWLEIMRSTRPTQLGLLARWDTEGLSGLYAIQLQAISEDGAVRRTYTVITLDN